MKHAHAGEWRLYCWHVQADVALQHKVKHVGIGFARQCQTDVTPADASFEEALFHTLPTCTEEGHQTGQPDQPITLR